MPTNPAMSRSVFAGKLGEYSGIAFSDAEAYKFRGTWNDVFRKRMGSIFGGTMVLEIGCFNADYLSNIAAEHPDVAFVGIDWKCKAIYDGAKRITEMGLPNVILLRARGQDLAKLFSDREIDEIWVFHPDPCDREEQRKNRLINPRFLLEAHSVLRGGKSALFLKTDHRDYYLWVLDLFARHEQEPRASAAKRLRSCFRLSHHCADFWNDMDAQSKTSGRYFFGKRTLFENRYIKRRLPIFMIEMLKK